MEKGFVIVTGLLGNLSLNCSDSKNVYPNSDITQQKHFKNCIPPFKEFTAASCRLAV